MNQADDRNLPVRISDVERQRVVEHLRRCCADGRLTLDEFEERSAEVYAARTQHDLDTVTRGLPEVPKPPNSAAIKARKAALRGHITSYLAVNAFLVLIWLLTTPGGYFWPIWPMAGWGFGLLMHVLAERGLVEKDRGHHHLHGGAINLPPMPSLPNVVLPDLFSQTTPPSQPTPADDADRVLKSVLITDIVGSTAEAIRLGDREWGRVLARHHELARTEIVRRQGRFARDTGDGIVATFDGPARAVNCALAFAEAVSSLGITIRAGVHTGEVDLHGDDVTGVAVHIAARVADLAQSDEVLVSSTVRDLVTGTADIVFEDRGTHALKGLSDEWRLFAAHATPAHRS